MSKGKKDQKTFEYKAEMKQLLNLIVNSLYTHPEVFLRELISNASDALNKIRFRALTDQSILASQEELQIKIEVDSKKKSFSIEDNGIGMEYEELINNLGTVARSGTLEFLEQIKKEGKPVDDSLIGKFGVGFYSVFMVTDEVIVETRSVNSEGKGFRWTSSGQGAFTIEEIEKKDRGTKISFLLKQGAFEFAEEHTVQNIIKKYSNFAEFSILLNGKKVNTVSALWHKKDADISESELNEFYKFVSNDFDNPLGHLHLALEGAVNFKALMFIPQTAPFDLMRLQEHKSLHLYSNKILIQNDCKELLPEYLRFVKGVVDTADLPLNVSREVTQKSAAMNKIRDILTSKLLAFLKDWAENDQEKYKKFYRNFGPLLKTGINSDFTNREKIIELLRFESTKTAADELVSLKTYLRRMKQDQKEIYYLSGDNRESIMRNPNLEYFKKNDIEVLLLTEPVDIFIIPSIPEYEKKPIKSIDKADIEVIPENKIERPDDTLTASLISLFKETLKDLVEDVVESKRLVDSPVTLVTGKDGMDNQMEKMMKLMNKDFKGTKKILEVNLSHPIIRNLSRMFISSSGNPLLRTCIHQLYESALLIEGNLASPNDFVSRMFEIMEEATQ